MFSHTIRTVNFRAKSFRAPHVGPHFFFFFFTFPVRQLKCKRTSTYSHQWWCRGGKGLWSVGEFHAHHPSFPASKAWIHVLVCISVYVSVCASKGMHSLKFSLSGIPDTQILTHFTSIHRLDLFLPLGGPTSTLPQQKKVGATAEESVFSSRLARHEYFAQATWFPQCHPTQKERSLVEQAEGKSQVGIWLWGTTCSQWQTSRQSLGDGAVTGLVKPYLTTSACVSARPATWNSPCLGKTISTSPGMCLHCWLCVDGEDGRACGHTRHSKSAIKPNWRWGIKPGLCWVIPGQLGRRRLDREV